MATRMRELSLEEALANDAYEWLAINHPDLIDAIKFEIEKNKRSPEDIKRIVAQQVGPDRNALAMRCYQAARAMYYFPVEA